MTARHPNTGPCQRCGEDTAPRYNNGFGNGASHHCEKCQTVIADELKAERARQKKART